MTDPPAVQLVEEFYANHDDDTEQKQYYWLDTGGRFEYAFLPTPDGMRAIADRIDGTGYRQRAAATLFRIAARTTPSLLWLVPQVTRTWIEVSQEPDVIYAIVDKKAITLLSPEAGTVVQLGRNANESFVEEYQHLRSLPAFVNAPNAIDVGDDPPYLMQEYIDGRSPRDLVADWQHLRDALETLARWAHREGIEWKEMDVVLSDLEANLEEYDDPAIDEALDALNSVALPDVLAHGPTHGDVTVDNMFIRDGDPYLIDWSASKPAYLVQDFVFPFYHWCQHGAGSTGILHEFISQENQGGKIVREYSEAVGLKAWNSEQWFPGLVLIGLLYELTDKPPDHRRSKNVKRIIHGLPDVRRAEAEI